MKTSTIVIWVVILLVLAAGVWYFLSPSGLSPTVGSNTATSTAEASSTTSTGATGTTGGKSLNEVVAQGGGNYTCTISTLTQTTAGAGQFSGSVYSSAGKTRVDAVSRVNGTDVTIHVIRSGGFAYTWIDGQTTGTKTAYTASTPLVQQPTGGTIASTDNANLSSNCTPWVPDTSKFVLPSAIKFIAH